MIHPGPAQVRLLASFPHERVSSLQNHGADGADFTTDVLERSASERTAETMQARAASRLGRALSRSCRIWEGPSSTRTSQDAAQEAWQERRRGLRDVPTSTRCSSTKTDDFELLQDEEGAARIEGYSEEGFLINSVEVEGSVICYQKLFLLWNVNAWKEVTPDTLALVDAVKPAPELLLLGSGKTYQHPSPELSKWLDDRRLAHEVMDTAHAVSTYNVLAQEGRRVIAAVLTVDS